MNSKGALFSKIRHTQLDLVYSTRTYSILTMFIGEIGVYLIMLNANRYMLHYWLVYMVCVDLYRLYDVHNYQKQKHNGLKYNHASRILYVLTVLSGAGWGASALILFPYLDAIHQVILISTLVAVSTGATATLAYIKNLAIIFVLLIIVPLIISIFMADKSTLVLAILMFAYALFLIKNILVFYHNNEKLLKLEIEAHEREHELDIQREKAVQANRAKSVFLANISHELRTPMHAILGFSELGINKFSTAPAEKLQGYFSRIQQSGQRLLALLNNLLDVSKFEAGRMQVEKQRANLRDTINIVVEGLAPLLHERGHKVVLQMNTNNTEAMYDSEQISRVISNLLSNAIKFSPPDSNITIEVDGAGLEIPGRTEPQVEAISLSVIDQGIGIPDNELDMIFDPFLQSSRNDNEGGTGLGLSICREIIQMHHGIIRAINKPHGGAIFSFIIPREPPETIAEKSQNP